jgi:hypothetical protein
MWHFPVFEQLLQPSQGSILFFARLFLEDLSLKKKARHAVNDMIFAGWRCSVESYAEIMKALEKAKR